MFTGCERDTRCWSRLLKFSCLCCTPIHHAVHLLTNKALFTVCHRSMNMFGMEKMSLICIAEMESL